MRTRAQKWHRWSTCQPWKILKMSSMAHETTRKSKIEQVSCRRSALEAENASPLVPNEQHRLRPWSDWNRKVGKNDEFTHVKRPPLSILNEKTAIELTTLFLERFQSIEAQNGPLATDVRFPLVKLTFASPQNWIFNGFWPSKGGGVTLRPRKVSPQVTWVLPREKWAFDGSKRLTGGHRGFS